VVRGPAALLAAYGGALAYLLLAPVLPTIADDRTAASLSGAVGAAVLGLCAIALAAAWNETTGLALIALGAALLAITLTAADATVAATIGKLLFASAAGLLLARAFASHSALVAIPVFVAAIQAATVLGAPATTVIRDRAEAADVLTFPLPAWGDGAAGAKLGLVEILFLACFAGFAWRYGLRRAPTACALVAAVVATVAFSVAADRTLPALPGLALALLLPNLDRVAAVLRGAHAREAARSGNH